MFLWTSDIPQPCACDTRRPLLSCATCRAQIEAWTYAVGPWLVLALVVWVMTALGVRADDLEHAAAMERARPQVERAQP
jgi:hypothetical protein